MKLSEVIDENINENTILVFESGKYRINSGEMHIKDLIIVDVKNLISEDLYTIEEKNNIVVLSRKKDEDELNISFNEIVKFDKMYILEQCCVTLGDDIQINSINCDSLFESDLTLEQENKIADRLHSAKRIKV